MNNQDQTCADNDTGGSEIKKKEFLSGKGHEQQLQEMRDQIDALTAKIAEYEACLKLCERELEQAGEWNSRLAEMGRSLEQEKEYWRCMYYDIQCSASWKATKGLRFVGRLARRIRKKVRG